MEKIREQKQQALRFTISKYATKQDLSDAQQADLKRKQSNFDRLQATQLQLPTKRTYQGLPHILLGVVLGRHQPATVSIVDVIHNKVLLSQTTRQLLAGAKAATGNNPERLLERQRRIQRQTAYKRHISQKKGKLPQIGEAELGAYLDRVLAKAIVVLAQRYQASRIVLPDLKHIRERLSSELNARAEKKCPGSVSVQKKYKRAYAMTIHRWSYNRLAEAIQGCAKKMGLEVEFSFQPFEGKLQEKARDIAIAAYNTHQVLF